MDASASGAENLTLPAYSDHVEHLIRLIWDTNPIDLGHQSD